MVEDAHNGTATNSVRVVRSRSWLTRRSAVTAFVALLASAALGSFVLVGVPSSATPPTAKTRSATISLAHNKSSVANVKAPVVPTTTTSTTPVATVAPTQAAAVATPVVAVAQPSVAALVEEVEEAGIDPGSTWTWAMGDTSTECGALPQSGSATGCTFWASGVEKTDFSGTPSLSLVAHEVANAETEADAVPSLLSQVAAAAGGSSWSPTDAVASCLVAHFLGFQDNAAGTWQCPAALGAVVAAEIHQSVTTTQITAVCGTSSGISSTIVFTASAGTLTVTANGSPAGTATAGVPVTTSGVGTFAATDQGGTVSETGACQA